MAKPSKILSVDFDGVLHEYSSGWQGADIITDRPVPGAMAFLEEAVKYFVVNIFSSRSRDSNGIIAMQNWVAVNYAKLLLASPEKTTEFMAKLRWPTEKPASHLSIDDRGFCFEGIFPTMKEIDEFVPWTKRERSN